MVEQPWPEPPLPDLEASRQPDRFLPMLHVPEPPALGKKARKRLHRAAQLERLRAAHPALSEEEIGTLLETEKAAQQAIEAERAAQRIARKAVQDVTADNGWALSKETWALYRSMWQVHGVVLAFGEYSQIARAIRGGKAERLRDDPALWRVTHAGRDLIVATNKLNQPTKVRGHYESEAERAERRVAERRAAKKAEKAAMKEAEKAKPKPPVPAPVAALPVPPGPARVVQQGTTLRLVGALTSKVLPPRLVPPEEAPSSRRRLS